MSNTSTGFLPEVPIWSFDWRVVFRIVTEVHLEEDRGPDTDDRGVNDEDDDNSGTSDGG